MKTEVKAMINMAEAIAKINGVDIERLDLQKIHVDKDGEFDFYGLDAWYSDGKQIRIREDCTIVD